MAKREYRQDECFDTVTLVGGFIAALSNSERNEWNEHANSLPGYKEYCAAQDSVAAALVVAGAGDSTHDHAQRLCVVMAAERDLRAPLYEIGKAWYGELVKRRAAEAEATPLEAK